MLKRRHCKKNIKLLTICVMGGAILASPIAIVSQHIASNTIFDTRAILYQVFENENLIDELHFCKSTYISNEHQIDPTKITIGYDTTSFKIISLEWRNASATIQTVGANFASILDWFNTNRPAPMGNKWTFKDESVLKGFFDNATTNRAKWGGKLTWPGLNIPANIFNSYYLLERLYNWDSVEIQNGCLSIGNEAFHGIPTLHDVWFPASLTQIGSLAFSSSGIQVCNLIGGQLSSIGDHAFYQCNLLTNIVIKTDSNSNLTIGDECFKYDGTTITSPAEARNITLYAKNIGELKKSCFAFKNTSSSLVQGLSSFTFGYLKPLTTINKASISPWSDTTATNIYVPRIYENQNGVLNAWDSFFPIISTIIPTNGIGLDFLHGYHDEIYFDYTNGYDGTTPIIAAHSLAENYAENLDINKITIGLYTCHDMNPPKQIDTETLIFGVTFDKTVLTDGSIGFTIHISPNEPYFTPSSGTNVSKTAWIAIKYDNLYVRYRLCYFYNATVERATSTSGVQVFLNGIPTTTTTIPVDLTNATGDKTYNINTAWFVDTTKLASISADDVLSIDPSVSTYPNIEYDQIQKRISFHPLCLPNTYTFQFSVTIQSASAITIVKNFSLAFVVSRTPDSITIHNDYSTFISGLVPKNSNDINSNDVRPSIYYLTTNPARCDNDADWEIVPNDSAPLPLGLFIKQNNEQAPPSSFHGTNDEWDDISGGQLWTDHDISSAGTFTFKVKATIKGTAISSITSVPQTITFVNADIKIPDIIKVDKRPFGDTTTGEVTISQNVEALLNVGFDYEPGFDYNLLQPYATLYDRDHIFPNGLSVIQNTGSDKALYPYKIRANITSPPGDYYITIGGRSSVFYSISVHEYTIILHVLPKPADPIVFPTTLIILLVITGLLVSVIVYFLIKRLVHKH